MATEKRLIDANALGRDAFHIKQWEKGIRCVVDWDDIEAAPTVDAVEVVRCKDCRFWVHEFYNVGICNYAGIHLDHADYGFCSYGERRSSDGN